MLPNHQANHRIFVVSTPYTLAADALTDHLKMKLMQPQQPTWLEGPPKMAHSSVAFTCKSAIGTGPNNSRKQRPRVAPLHLHDANA